MGRQRTSGWMRGVAFLAVGIALSSCDTQDIGQGYSIEFADRGKAWIEKPDRSRADGDVVLSVWTDDEVIVYQVHGVDHPGCDYRMIRKADGLASPISPEEALEAVTTRAAKLRASTSSSCPLGSSQR